MADVKASLPAPGDAPNYQTQGPGAPAGSANDPTLVGGQDPASLFGVEISYNSGAAGSGTAAGVAPQDPTNMPNQYPSTEPISGVRLDGSGAPGGPGAGDLGDNPAGMTVTLTDPNYTAGRPGGQSGNQFIQAHVQIGGPLDSTTVPGQYADSVATNLPHMSQPESSGAGQGRVLRGGWLRGQR